MNGTGPEGYGPMTGRGMGRCGGHARFDGSGYGMGTAHGFGRGREASYGPGRGMGSGQGIGRGLGWFAAGYQGVDERTAGANIRSALETRIAALRAELARTEDLLRASNTETGSSENSGK
ncbi:MAG: DUF5320 domain-containing protein [Clostridia bacterium]